MAKVKSEEVLQVYKENPAASLKEIADLFEVSVPTIQYHTKKLQKMGLLTRTRGWRSVEVLNKEF